MYIKFSMENIKVRDCSEELGIDEKLILKLILEK